MIDISVIIVNWNTKTLLLDCVASLYQTTREAKMEIIVVDNASTDGSVDAMRQSFPQVKIIENLQNFGFAKANNIGIRKAQGRYICLVNSDVKALDGVLDNMHTYMEKHSSVGALAPKIYGGDMQIQKNCREFPNLRNIFCEEFFLNRLFPRASVFRGRDMIDCNYDVEMEVEVLSGCFMMVRREAIDRVGLLDERFFFYSEDMDWCKRIYDADWKLIHYPGAEIIHYGGASSDTAPTRFRLEMLKANWQYWRKHKSMIECALFWLIEFAGKLGRAIGWYIVRLVGSKRQPEAKMMATAYRKILKWLINPRLIKS